MKKFHDIKKYTKKYFITSRLISCSYENCDEIFESLSAQQEHQQNIHTIQTFQLINDDDSDNIDDEFSDNVVLIEMDGEETNVTTLKQDLCVAEQFSDDIRVVRSDDLNVIKSDGQELNLSLNNVDDNHSEDTDNFINATSELYHQAHLLMENDSVLQDSTSQLVQLQQNIKQHELLEQQTNSNINNLLKVHSEQENNQQRVFQLNSPHDTKLPTRFFQNLQDSQMPEINTVVVAAISQVSPEIKLQKPKQFKYKDANLIKSSVDNDSSRKGRKNNLPKPKMFESVLLQNRLKISTKSETLFPRCLTDNDSLTVNFPPLPSSPPDTLLDVAIPHSQDDMHEINQVMKQKLMEQSEFDFVLDNSSSASQEYQVKRDDDNIIINFENESLYKCTDCSLIISDPQDISSHICTDILDKQALTRQSSIKKESGPKERAFECELCKKKFTTKKVLKRHAR